MKQKYKWLIGALATSFMLTTSCVDEIKFGNSFLDKPAGGTATIDTVFGSAIYTQQFLNGIYGRQYYGLPYYNGTYVPSSSDTYTGKFEALTDCWQLHWSGANLYSQYYNGSHTAKYSRRQDKFCYNDEKVWEVVRECWILMENIDRVPDLSESEKARMIAEAKCLIAVRYFDMFRHYGGLPLVYASFSGTDASYDYPRATVEKTVEYMIDLLDQAIDGGALPWAYDGGKPETSNQYTGRWTKAGAMALKCKIWQFAASPLFNDVQGYAGGGSEAEQQHLVWYGGKRTDLWDKCLKACQDFFEAVEQNGFYALRTATAKTAAQYRQAYRMGYIYQGSTEVIHSVRVKTTDNFSNNTYKWHEWQMEDHVERFNYTPTQEYIEMFPWADGKPFDWDELLRREEEGGIGRDTMFVKGEIVNHYQDPILTRDPRLYETARINGVPVELNFTTGEMAGDHTFENWVGGYDADLDPESETNLFATGYANLKYFLGPEYLRQYTQWVTLRLSDLMLTYAEALLQAQNDNTSALIWIDKVRDRVGLKGLVECNPDKRLDSDHDALLEELLRERVCELGMEDSRFFDLIRYKRQDLFEKRLHGLRIFRPNPNATGEDDKYLKKPWFSSTDYGKTDQPVNFKYEKFELANPVRYWWKYGFDPKWYLSPFPQTEINKGYGLIQNPGW